MRFIDVGGELTLQAGLKQGWQHIYRVIPYPRYDGEYEITNWYTATHPDTNTRETSSWQSRDRRGIGSPCTMRV